MMFHFTKPDRSSFENFLADAQSDAFSYSEVGSTAAELTENYTIDHNCCELGTGLEIFRAAKEAMDNWEMFNIGWVELCEKRPPIIAGQTIALQIEHFGFYSLNATRIVYTIDEPNRYGFAYGTLTQHGEIGEERFTVDLDEQTNTVSYDILAMSRPSHILAKLGYPLTRYLQRRFAADSMQAMKMVTSLQNEPLIRRL